MRHGARCRVGWGWDKSVVENILRREDRGQVFLNGPRKGQKAVRKKQVASGEGKRQVARRKRQGSGGKGF